MMDPEKLKRGRIIMNTDRPSWQRWVLGYAWVLAIVAVSTLVWWFVIWLFTRAWS